jgi:hypothetical protein
MQDHTSIDATTVQLLLNLHELLNGAMLVAFESRQRSHDGSGGNSLFDLDVVLEQDGDRVTRRFLLRPFQEIESRFMWESAKWLQTIFQDR